MKIKSGSRIGAQVSLIFNIFFLLICFVGFIVDRNLKMLFLIFLIFTFVIWTIWMVCVLFSKTIYVTEKQIVAKRFNKILWAMAREEIIKIKYNQGSVLDVLLGVPTAGAVILYVRENSPILRKKFYKLNYLSFFCSKRNFEKIQKLGYESLVD